MSRLERTHEIESYGKDFNETTLSKKKKKKETYYNSSCHFDGLNLSSFLTLTKTKLNARINIKRTTLWAEEFLALPSPLPIHIRKQWPHVL